MTVTPASIALSDLVATMTQIDRLYSKPGVEVSDKDSKLIDQLEARRDALERQLQDEVRTKLGVDYAVLWLAVTPDTTPKL